MYNYSVINRQKGAALIIGLIMLATATIVGVAGVMASLTEERIAGNHRQIAEAFMSAETGISDGYAQVVSTEVDFKLPEAKHWEAGQWKPQGDANAGKPEAANPLQDCIMDYGLREEENGEWIQKESDRIICAARLKDENNPQAGYMVKVGGNDGINASGSNGNGNWKIEHLNFVYAVKQDGDYVKKIPNPDPNETPPELVVTHETPNAVQIATMRVTGTIDGTKRAIEVNLFQPQGSAGFNEDDPFGWGGSSDPPAAVSCLGGACNLHAGAANGVRVDGRDHPYPIDCQGNSCWLSHITPVESPKPSVFLSDFDGSLVTRQGGGPNPPYCGADNSDPDAAVCGDNRDANSVWRPSNYPDDAETGESTAPARDHYFSEEFLDRLEQHRDNTEFGAWSTNEDGTKEYQPQVTFYDPTAVATNPTGNDNNAGILVVDGTNYDRNGTGVFVGLVVVMNCGKVSTGGNFNIFGAILIDAESCEEPNYDPYGGNGTPSIRFSRDAMGLAGRALNEGDNDGGEGNGDIGRVAILSWQEIQ